MLLALFSVAQAQQKATAKPQPPIKPKASGVNCSEAQIEKACSSFKQLAEAHDKDILESLEPPSYVCFRPNEDAFLIFHVDAPNTWTWKKSDDEDGQIQTSRATLTTYRGGLLDVAKAGLGYWRRSWSGQEPYFDSESTEGIFKGLKITILPTQVFVEYPFQNQNGGTTQYSLTIRRSTGRFTETFAVNDTPSTTNSGTCLVLR
ncbi:MAG: hypothetical protein ABSF62_02765 [Bryobacteraceae bacterium]